MLDTRYRLLKAQGSKGGLFVLADDLFRGWVDRYRCVGWMLDDGRWIKSFPCAFASEAMRQLLHTGIVTWRDWLVFLFAVDVLSHWLAHHIY